MASDKHIVVIEATLVNLVRTLDAIMCHSLTSSVADLDILSTIALATAGAINSSTSPSSIRSTPQTSAARNDMGILEGINRYLAKKAHSQDCGDR